MKFYGISLCLLATIFLYACKQANKTVATNQDTIAKTVNNPIVLPSKNASPDTSGLDDCPRGASEPVIKKNVFPDTHFALQADHKTGIETLVLKNGDKLTIKQSGCEYYILNFRFETSRFAADTADVAYWGDKALLLMRQVIHGLNSPLEINEALNKLSARLEKDKSGSGNKLALKEEIDFGGSDPRQYFTIDRITKLENHRYALMLSLSYGPI